MLTLDLPVIVAIIVILIASFIYYRGRMNKIKQELEAAKEKAERLAKYEAQLLLEKEEEERIQKEEKLLQEAKQRDIEFNNKYKIRKILKQDHSDIIEICENIYNGTDYVSSNFIHFFE